MKPLSAITQVVVVTFNPELKLLEENLLALSKQFENILIVDNYSRNINELCRYCRGKNFELKKLSDNYGIAYAQNIGLKTAAEKKLDWLLTMDQDSIIPNNFSNEYIKVIKNFDNIGLIGWSQHEEKPGTVRQDWLILSSGCLLSVKALNECDGFDENFFIDHVDTDANIKIRNLGYKTLTTNTVKLVHQLGAKSKAHKTIRGNPYIAHSPVRIYYNIRNGTVLIKRYLFSQPNWTRIIFVNNIREGIYLLMFQPRKTRNFFLLLRAWFDGVFNRLGKMN